MSRIVFAGREVWPFVEGGGIGRYVWTTANMLAPHHEVTILTTGAHREAFERMRADGDERLPEGVELAFVDEPEGDVAPFGTLAQAWSARLLDALVALEADVAEFGDYHGEGFAAVHARRGGDPRLRGTTVAVRTHTSGEMATGLNETPPAAAHAYLWALERFTIRHADVLLWPGGDVLDRYRAFYGDLTAEPVRLPLPVRLEDLLPAENTAAPPAEGPLRMLFLNRLERRKGIIELVEALRAAPEAQIELTVVGRDTDTAPGGGSMRAHVERLADGRVNFREQVPHDQVPALIAAHHAVALPVRWETFSYVAREALAANRPVLASPAGAIPEVVIPGRSGWLQTTLDGVTREAAEAMTEANGPRSALEDSLMPAEELAAAYARLADRPAWKAPAAQPIAAVVTVRAGDAGVERTLRSLRAQRGVSIRIAIEAEPGALAAHLLLATGGPGDEPLVLRVPAGAELEPAFAARCAQALAANPSFDYATARVGRGRRPWHAPLGGEDLLEVGADAAASVALVRRAVADRDDLRGLAGVVLQEPLVRRLPRRTADPLEPAHGGAPSPAAMRAAFEGVI